MTGRVNKKIWLVMLVFTFLVLTARQAYGKYNGGSGTAEDPYLIYTPEQMNSIGAEPNDWDKHFVLVNDINVAKYDGTKFNIIGIGHSHAFKGVFDGNGHRILNFTYTTDEGEYIGIFGCVYDNDTAEIKNLGLINPRVETVMGDRVGTLVGNLMEGKVANCYVINGFVCGDGSVGGLIGSIYTGQVSQCYADCNVVGNSYVGGLVGGNIDNGSISGCESISLVQGQSRTGGLVGSNSGEIWDSNSAACVQGIEETGVLVGFNNGYGNITNCHSGGVVIGTSDVGGIAGKNIGTLNICSSDSNVTGTDNVGGLTGYNYCGEIFKCYSTGNICGDIHVGGLTGETDGEISECWSSCNISGNSYVGGLAGYTDKQIGISNSYFEGNVEGNYTVGGLVGLNNDDVINCYSIGRVLGAQNTGGLIGDNCYNAVLNSYWDVETSGQNHSDAGEGKTTEQMKTAVTFIGWGCDGLWSIDETNDYPRLIWENRPGQVIINERYWQGNGTAEDPFLIFTTEELNMIGRILCEQDKHFMLMNDIDMSTLSGEEFNIIGYTQSFKGVFDGDNHAIINYTYDSNTSDYKGLFGVVGGPNANIRNIRLIDAYVSAPQSSCIGLLVGSLDGGHITNCSVENCFILGKSNVGGLVGNNRGLLLNCNVEAQVQGEYAVGGLSGKCYAEIANSHFCGAVSGDTCIGGLAGYSSRTYIHDCSCTGNVDGSDEQVGGLIGQHCGGDIVNCHVDCNVTGDGDYIGGLLGRNYRYNDGGGIIIIILDYSDSDETNILSGCSFRGSVVGGGKYVGGLAGQDYYSEVSDCQSFCTVEGESCVGGLIGENAWSSSSVRDCITSADVIGHGDYVGGLIGSGSHITNCHSSGTVRGHKYVGGMCGAGYDIFESYSTSNVFGFIAVGGLVGTGDNLKNCFAAGDVQGDISYVGGFAGYVYRNEIFNCYARGNVSGIGSYVGGLIGYNENGYIMNSYSVGMVSGANDVGGLVGYNEQGEISASFWDIETSGQSYSDGGTGKTTAEMQTESTFTSAGWDFIAPIWTIDEGIDYPILRFGKKELRVPEVYSTIQTAINAAFDGDTVIIAPGIYTGDGNRDIDFLGKAITVRSTNPSDLSTVAATVIDCNGSYDDSHRGFYFHCSEDSNSVLNGIKIVNGCAAGGGISCASSSPTIVNCILSCNSTPSGSGGGICIYTGSPTVTNCIITGNFAKFHGAGIFNHYGSPVVTNCTFSGNYAQTGSAISNIWQDTIVNNCIFWDNNSSGGQIYGSVIVEYSNIQGGFDGQSNIDADPCFIELGYWADSNDPNISVEPNELNAIWIDGDYHLKPNSPCIDAGDPNSEFGLEPEPDGGRINMGAYGNTPEATCKGGLVLQSYNLVSKTRVGRTIFEYTYTMALNNNSTEAVSNVLVELLDASDNVTILDPDVGFAYIEAGESAVSDDTFSIQVDRSVPVDVTIISWRTTFDTTGGGAGQTTFTTSIALNNSVSDITGDGEVNLEDLAKLAEQWLGPPGTPSADIAPPGGDGIVNFLDFAKLAEDWMK